MESCDTVLYKYNLTVCVCVEGFVITHIQLSFVIAYYFVFVFQTHLMEITAVSSSAGKLPF